MNYFQIRHIYHRHHILITYTTPISQTYRVRRTLYVVHRCLWETYNVLHNCCSTPGHRSRSHKNHILLLDTAYTSWHCVQCRTYIYQRALLLRVGCIYQAQRTSPRHGVLLPGTSSKSYYNAMLNWLFLLYLLNTQKHTRIPIFPMVSNIIHSIKYSLMLGSFIPTHVCLCVFMCLFVVIV